MTSSDSPIPITVFTGFLGAGKTSVILSLLPKLPQDYKAVLLKNEFGDIEVDSKLANESSLAGVSEILNGCMCCVLVGQMQTALLETREKFRPDRILIECSGSAFPATLAFQIREIEKQTEGDLKLDAIVTVIDAENFVGYEDQSPTARMQASYTDIILINKWEHVSEQQLDEVIDHLNTLNDATPKIKCQGRNGVDPNLIFGLQSELFLEPPTNLNESDGAHHDEVETATLYSGGSLENHSHNHSGSDCPHCKNHDIQEQQGKENSGAAEGLDREILTKALQALSRENTWRVKGFLRLNDKDSSAPCVHILNWAFGRYELRAVRAESANEYLKEAEMIRLTVMGERGEVKKVARRLAGNIGANVL
ncbi:COBW domain-containing protein C15D4.05 [Leucoagaricus sp. SymC.cos]|nr:COBW domain-containing protein C15D4.05 [Leucoagaricus sp. SymC.cos]